jgi:MATE family multidrug resistance protein
MAAFSLATLSGNMTCISIIIGTLSASETLQPRAFSLKQYETVGIIALRGFIMCLLYLTIPIIILNTPSVLSYIFIICLGQDPIVTSLSIKWIHIYLYSIPFILLFRVVQRFLACQNVVMPCVIGSFVSSVLIHPFCVRLWIKYFGFNGSVLSIVVTQFIQLCITLLYIYQCNKTNDNNDDNNDDNDNSNNNNKNNKKRLYIKETWNVQNTIKSWNDILTKAILSKEGKEGMISYAKLSIGGIFALTEWWYWESICFVAGKLGVLSLCVHSITYQLIPLIYMIPLGFSIGLSVRVGQLLPIDVYKAKVLVCYTMMIVIVLASIVTALIYYNEYWIISLFTTDEDVMYGCHVIWNKVCSYVLGLYIFCLNGGILRALGLQMRMGVTIVTVLWCFSLPCIIYFCILGEYSSTANGVDTDIDMDIDIDIDKEEQIQGLLTMWRILFWSYIILNIGLITCYVTADWDEIGRKAALSTSNLKPPSSNGDDNNGNNDNNGINDGDDLISYDIEEDANVFTSEESSLLSYDSKSIMLVAPSKAD